MTPTYNPFHVICFCFVVSPRCEGLMWLAEWWSTQDISTPAIKFFIVIVAFLLINVKTLCQWTDNVTAWLKILHYHKSGA